MDKAEQTFRERVPIIAKMVDRGFNGDREEDKRIAFILIAIGPDGDEDEQTLSVTTNVATSHEVVRIMVAAIAEAPEGGTMHRIVVGAA